MASRRQCFSYTINARCALATRSTPGAWLGPYRLMAIDGTIEEVPDSAANSKRFGRSENQHSASAYPQIRCVDLIECGTHAIVAARIRSYRSNAHGMARNLLGHLTRRC